MHHIVIHLSHSPKQRFKNLQWFFSKQSLLPFYTLLSVPFCTRWIEIGFCVIIPMTFRGHCQKEGKKILKNKPSLCYWYLQCISHRSCSLLTFNTLLDQTGEIRLMTVQLSKALKKCKANSENSSAHIAYIRGIRVVQRSVRWERVQRSRSNHVHEEYTRLR